MALASSTPTSGRALRVALLYAAFGAVWIAASDWIAARLVTPGSAMIVTQTLKGLLYVGVTALVVYLLVRSAEARLRRSQALQRAMIDCSPVALYTCDLEGRTLTWNESAERVFGWRAEEVLGRPLPIVPEDKEEEFAALRRRVIEGEVLAGIELVRERKDGTRVDVALSAARVEDAEGHPLGILGVVEDISTRKRTERALRESEARLRRIIEEAPFPATLHAEDGVVLFVNRVWEELTGYPAADLPTVAEWARRAYGTRQDEVLPGIEQLYGASGRVTEGEFEIRCADGSRRIWDFSSTPLGALPDGRRVVLSMAADVTERKRAEGERERLRAAIEQTAEAVIVTDTAGAIQYVNPAFERISGHSREEAFGQGLHRLLRGGHDTDFYRGLWETLARGATWQGRIVNRRKDGTLYTTETVLSPVRDAEGRIVSFVGVMQDITDRLALEAQYRHAQKMESVGRLAGGVAHDFNNMLGAILGFADLELLNAEPGTTLQESLREIRRAAERSAELTRQLLAFARRQPVDPRVLDPNQAVGGALQMLRRLIGERITLDWQPGEGVWPVRIDPGQLDQVLTNLCVNAADAIDDVGRIRIETRNRTLDAAQRRELGTEASEMVMLAVRDDGSGMDPETLEHLFEPFFTTKQAGRGTGLGLATVYGIVEQNGGRIRVSSAPDKGTSIEVFLPRSTGPVTESGRPAGSESEAGRGETVLVVEDEAQVLVLATRLLENLGYRVLAAHSSEEAIRLAQAHPDEIHLLLTDVVMPDMNGRDLAERVRRLRPRIRCLFTSGYAPGELLTSAGGASSHGFLAKPYTRQSLATKVREALAPPAPPGGTDPRGDPPDCA